MLLPLAILFGNGDAPRQAHAERHEFVVVGLNMRRRQIRSSRGRQRCRLWWRRLLRVWNQATVSSACSPASVRNATFECEFVRMWTDQSASSWQRLELDLLPQRVSRVFLRKKAGMSVISFDCGEQHDSETLFGRSQLFLHFTFDSQMHISVKLSLLRRIARKKSPQSIVETLVRQGADNNYCSKKKES